MDNRKNLLVTLADKKYILLAKQLFSSVYWNAGWEGDYMLLSHEIPEEDLKWFRDKEILIMECKPLHTNTINYYPPVVLDKYYLFTEAFKKWKNIVFLDADIIVKAPLERLTKIKYLGATRDINFSKLYTQFYNPSKDNFNNRIYNLNDYILNSGVISFNTDIITPQTFKELNNLLNDYISEFKYGEQPVLNLYFYKKWERLPLVYNTFLMVHNYKLPLGLKCIVMHFISDPLRYYLWDATHPFYKEWKMNLDKAEFIDLNKIQKVKEWNTFKITYYAVLSKIISPQPVRVIIQICYAIPGKLRTFIYYIIYTPDRILGTIGNFIKKKRPDLYHKLRKIKDGK